MKKIDLNPIRGFRDLYPKDKALQNYIFEKVRHVAKQSGFEEYEGPIVEPMDIYLGKTSRELLEEQTFLLQGKKGQTTLLRPEMTPSLARMIAARSQEFTYPLRLFNIGVRFRYEAPQKGRAREFYQTDFDIIGSDSILADAAILNTAVSIFLAFGATENDFIVSINSRKFIEGSLHDFGLDEEKIREILPIIDRKSKIKQEEFDSQLSKKGIDSAVIDKINELLNASIDPSKNKYFEELFEILKILEIDTYCQINTGVVRGLDYYTGLVFEVWEKGDLKRAILGGGRYDNLVSDFNPQAKLPSVGFAASDVVLEEFLRDKNLIPTFKTKGTKVLVTVFSENTVIDSLKVFRALKKNNIPAELYLGIDVKLDKQIKYADRYNIPYIVLIGPEEIEKNVVKLKDMKKREQEELTLENLIKRLKI